MNLVEKIKTRTAKIEVIIDTRNAMDACMQNEKVVKA
jgi:hypothetical protein